MTTIIELNNLTIKAQEQIIIKDFSLSVEQGEWVAITGPSGSGKSTLLKYLAQLNDPALITEGTYLFNQNDVSQLDTVALRQQISYCYQSPTLFGDTVFDNLSFAYQIRNLDFDEQNALNMLDNVQLPREFINKRINTLSGGEKQRIALIRNVLFEPEVLLLDEITSALDQNTRQVIWQWLKEYHQSTGVTIIMISHLTEEQEFAGRQIPVQKLDKTGGHD